MFCLVLHNLSPLLLHNVLLLLLLVVVLVSTRCSSSSSFLASVTSALSLYLVSTLNEGQKETPVNETGRKVHYSHNYKVITVPVI